MTAWQRIDNWLAAFDCEDTKRVDAGHGTKRVRFGLSDSRAARPGSTWDEAVREMHAEYEEDTDDRD